MKRTTKLLSLFMALCMIASALVISAVPASAVTPLPIVIQNDAKWTGAANTYGTGTLRATGCGIFSLVNCVGYLTGKAMDVNEVAAWAYSIGAYNKGGADGTYRYELYPYVEARYGKKYGFTMDCNGTQGWWQGSSSTILKNHLKSGGVAIGHVPGHFIAIVGYDASKAKPYHLYDSYPTNSRNTYPGDVWVTEAHLKTSGLYLDWFCLMSLDSSSIASGPSISVNSTAAYGESLSVSWGKVDNAISYKYKVERFDGEMSGTSPVTIVNETSTTGTSFTIPAQSTGKYYNVTVTAVGEKDSKSSTSVVMVGPWVSYPSKVQYIPVNEINGKVTEANSCILTYDFTSNMTFKYWRGMMLAPNADGTYTVESIMENGTDKTISITSNKLIFMIHSAYAGYEYAANIKVGDKLTLCGIYVDKNTIRGTGYILVNGGIPLAPESITPGDGALQKDETNKAILGLGENTTVADTIKKFKEDNSYIQIRDSKGNALANDGFVGTGCTVNIVVDGAVTLSYALVVTGDINGDAGISSADYILQKQVISGTKKVEGAFALAIDFNGDKTDSAADYIALRAKIAGQ